MKGRFKTPPKISLRKIFTVSDMEAIKRDVTKIRQKRLDEKLHTYHKD